MSGRRAEEFLSRYFAYLGYGYLETPAQLVPNVLPLLFYSFRVMVGAGLLFIVVLGVVWSAQPPQPACDQSGGCCGRACG